MGAVILERRNDLPPVPVTGTTATVPNTVKKVCTLRKGQRLDLRCRYAEAYMNATTAPAPARLWEGPYLRFRPLYQVPGMSEGYVHEPSNAALISTYNGETITGSGGVVTVPNSIDQAGYFYEVDAIGSRGFFAPWDCDVDLVTGLSGIWAFDTSVSDGTLPPQGEQQFSQTRTLAGGGDTRTLPVPLGAEEFSILGTVTSVSAQFEDTGKTLGNGTTLMPLVASNMANLDRLPTGGARSLIVVPSGVANTNALISFWVNVR